MSDNLPVVDGRAAPDMLTAESKREAVAVSAYNGRVVIMGDETREEWITAQGLEAVDVEAKA